MKYKIYIQGAQMRWYMSADGYWTGQGAIERGYEKAMQLDYAAACALKTDTMLGLKKFLTVHIEPILLETFKRSNYIESESALSTLH